MKRRRERPTSPEEVRAPREGDAVGIVVRALGQECDLRIAGEITRARTPHGERYVVGDEVFVPSEAQTTTERVILGRSERRTALSRPDPHDPSQELVLVANVDLAVIVVSTQKPAFHPRLIDRFLVVAERGGVASMICVNKIDLVTPGERAALDALLDPYVTIGLPVVCVAASDGTGMDELRARIAGRTCVLVGHSGVGKSSITRALDPDGSHRVGEVRENDGRGRHTTTGASLVDLGNDTQLVDTPGVRSVGLFDVDRRTLGWYFPDFDAFRPACRFRDCTHIHEPRCGVREAAESGALPKARYDTYLRLFESL